MSMLNGITRAATQAQGQQAQNQQPRGQGEGLFTGPNQNQNQNQSAFQEARSQGGQGQPRVSRFTYTSGARMDPAQEDMTK